MIPLWPNINYLANQGSGNMSLSDGQGRAITDMDNGAKRVRRRFTKIISPQSQIVRMSYDELSLFEFFYANVIKDGSLWFYMPIQRGNKYIINLVMFAPEGSPSVTEAGFNVTNVSMDLLIRSITNIDQSVYDYFNMIGISLGIRLSRVVDEFVNEVYPSIVTGD